MDFLEDPDLEKIKNGKVKSWKFTTDKKMKKIKKVQS